jgi:hypothetical protein
VRDVWRRAARIINERQRRLFVAVCVGRLEQLRVERSQQSARTAGAICYAPCRTAAATG